MSSKQNALAGCLFEAIDDINFSNIIVLLEKHGADPNTIIPKLNIAPIHFAVGFENLEFAEKVTSLFLKKKANPNLLDLAEMTPLHIACIWGRATIVRMLLENGGDLDLKSSEGETAITYAIHENQYQVIETIQKFVFEEKIAKQRAEVLRKHTPYTPEPKRQDENFNTPIKDQLNEAFSTPVKKNHLKNALQNIEDKKFTPNRINYNYDQSSPYFINITHRKHKTSRENTKAVEEEYDEEEDHSTIVAEPSFQQQNLFELTEKNLNEFSQKMSQVIVINRLAIHKRRSYIKSWREKIQHIRKTDEHLDVDYINYLNSCNNVTLMDPQVTSDECKSSSDSFMTAKSDLQRAENAIRALPETKFIEHVEENYIHSDCESGVIFFEKKIISKGRVNLRVIEETEDDDADTSASTVTLPPLDYDTDALRKELKNLTGGNPGPITKNTKRLYLKQLVKLKKQPKLFADKNIANEYSLELQRTVTNFDYLENSLSAFLQLESQMSCHFIEHANHIKWREGCQKTSFIYLLIDPRLSDNLPLQYKDMEKNVTWAQFVSSIFYVGKGKRSRPYSHLYDAIKLFSKENTQLAERIGRKKNPNSNLLDGVKSKLNTNPLQESEKLNRIIDIWKSQLGVVCLHIFNNIIPCEAYTREAAIIEAIGLNRLTNMKRGDFYGTAKTYSMRHKRQMGVGLLYKAMTMYLAEGESQLKPFDLV